VSGNESESDSETSGGADPRIDHTHPKNRSRTGNESESSSDPDLADSQETFADREADDATATDAGDVVDELEADAEADAGAEGDSSTEPAGGGGDAGGAGSQAAPGAGGGSQGQSSGQQAGSESDQTSAGTEGGAGERAGDRSERILSDAIANNEVSGETTTADTGTEVAGEGGEQAVEGQGVDTPLGEEEPGTPAYRARQTLETYDDVGGSFATPEELDVPELRDNDLTPDAVEGVNLDDAIRFRKLSDGGASKHDMFLAATGEGDVMWVTTEDGYGAPLEGGAIQNALLESIDTDRLADNLTIPDVNVDQERDVVAVASLGSDADTFYNAPSGNLTKEGYLQAAAVKLLAGDGDLGANIVAAPDGSTAPIDFDLAGGRDIQDDQVSHFRSLVARRCRTHDLGTPTDQEFEIAIQTVAQAMDADTVRDHLDAAGIVNTRRRNIVIDNVNYAQRGDF